MLNCQYCNKEAKNLQGLHKHERHCHSNPDRKPQAGTASAVNAYFECYCSFCNRFCTSKNSLLNHERLCKANPNAAISASLGKKRSVPAWNKGLTAETDERVALQTQRATEALARFYIEHPEKLGSTGGCLEDPVAEAARRKKISESMKKNPEAGGRRQGSGRGKKGWYKGFFCDSTYELVYIIYNLDHNIEFKKCNRIYTYEYQGEPHKYYPDFELPDGSIVEIKGYHSEVVDLKTAAVTDRPIRVLFEKDLQYAFDWVKQNYTYSQLSDLYE